MDARPEIGIAAHRAAAAQKIVVLNPKGGSGKTTIATNLAAYYAAQGLPAALMDLDRQSSSTRWLKKRTDTQPAIHGVTGHDAPANVTRAFALRVPQHIERVIVDTSAALTRQDLVDVVRNAHRIIVPVLPSDIDIHCAAGCISDLLLHARVPRSSNRIAVVANRARRTTIAFRSLMRFLRSLGLPAVAVLRDSQNYVRAAESGVGIHELRPSLVRDDLATWSPLIDWVEHGAVPGVTSDCDLILPPDGNRAETSPAAAGALEETGGSTAFDRRINVPW
jgi:chromosome partitioning protein